MTCAPPLLTVREAAGRLAIDVRTVRKFIDSGYLPAVRLPGVRRMIRLAAADHERVRRELRGGD